MSASTVSPFTFEFLSRHLMLSEIDQKEEKPRIIPMMKIDIVRPLNKTGDSPVNAFPNKLTFR